MNAIPNLPASVWQQVKEDLHFVQGIQGEGASELHKSIFGMVDGPTYMNWFASHVVAIGYNPEILNANLPQAARVMILFHDAHHSEVVMISNISRFCTNCTEKMKMDAALYGTNN